LQTVSGAELPGSESRASGPHPTFDSTKSPDWAYDEGALGAGAFPIFRVIFEPGDRCSYQLSFYSLKDQFAFQQGKRITNVKG